MIFGLSHVDVPVTNLEAALRLYGGGLGFSERRRGPGFVDLDGSSCLLRLVETRQVEHPVTLRLSVGDVEVVARALTDAGARELYAPMRMEGEFLAQVADADGNALIVWRELSEDERGVVPALPTELTWEPEAEELLKSLLQRVPVFFRAMARRRVTANAEHLASATRRVERLHVIRSYVLSSARVTRYRLRKPLQEHGISPDDFREEFECEERL
ncbi:DUF2621 family protein [Hyalangium gracile]|uniref:DUF2621 family protein n=1 Tax=Hyalangium gracile TaxID=394092 RepID=UPI001CCE8651|nr:DUF2621 family protein [Hyalangium gracile]